MIKDYVVNRFKELLSGISGIGAALLAFFKGDWQKAWDTGKKAVFDLSGAGSGTKAISQIGSGWKGAMNAGKAASDLYTKNHAQKASQANVNSGIATPVGIPGAGGTAQNAPGPDDKKKKKAKKDAKDTADSIATGGTKHNYITMHFKEINGIREYAGSKSDTADKAGQEVLDVLLRNIASAVTAGV